MALSYTHCIIRDDDFKPQSPGELLSWNSIKESDYYNEVNDVESEYFYVRQQ